MIEPRIAVIGGTGVYDPSILQNVSQIVIETPYGPVRSQSGVLKGKQVAFIPRHGSKHIHPASSDQLSRQYLGLKKTRGTKNHCYNGGRFLESSNETRRDGTGGSVSRFHKK